MRFFNVEKEKSKIQKQIFYTKNPYYVGKVGETKKDKPKILERAKIVKN